MSGRWSQGTQTSTVQRRAGLGGFGIPHVDDVPRVDLGRWPRKYGGRERAGSVDAPPSEGKASQRHNRAASCMAAPLLRRGRRKLADWSVDQVASWAALTSLPLEVAQRLQENAISGQVLESLTEEDLVSVGIDKFGYRRQLLLCRRELCEQLDQEDRISEEDGTEVIEIHSPTASPQSSPRQALAKGPWPPPAKEGAAGAGYSFAPGPPEELSAGISHSSSPKSCLESIERAFMREMCTRLEQKAVDAHAPAPTREVSVPVESAGVAYRVDNSRLRSGLDGLEFHRSMSLSDTHGMASIPWGSVVYGTPYGSDWIKVGDLFLPMRLNGVPVLQRLLHSSRISGAPVTTSVSVASARTRSPPVVPRGSPGALLAHRGYSKASPPVSARAAILPPTLTAASASTAQETPPHGPSFVLRWAPPATPAAPQAWRPQAPKLAGQGAGQGPAGMQHNISAETGRGAHGGA